MNRTTPKALLMNGISPATGMQTCAVCQCAQADEQFDNIAYYPNWIRKIEQRFRGPVCMECVDYISMCDGCNDPTRIEEMIEQTNGDKLCSDCNHTPAESKADLLADYHRKVL